MLSIVRFAPINLHVAALVAMVGTIKNQFEKDINQLQFKYYEQDFTTKHISPERRSTDTTPPLHSSFADERITLNKSSRWPPTRTSGFLLMWAVAFHVPFIDCTSSLPQDTIPAGPWSCSGRTAHTRYTSTWISSSYTRCRVVPACVAHRSLCVQSPVSRLVFIPCTNARSHGVLLNTLLL
jgi:hypothetical protein